MAYRKGEIVDMLKQALRVKTDAFNDEIEHLVIACSNDLALSGVMVGTGTAWDNSVGYTNKGSLTLQAYILYAKAYFGYSQDSEKYKNAYEQLKISLCLSGSFNTTGMWLSERDNVPDDNKSRS